MQAEVLDGPHGLERACHHLGGSRAARVVGYFRFKQLSVGEDDPELVVQAVEQEAEFGRFIHVAPHDVLASRHEPCQAWFRCSCCHTVSVAG